MERDGEKKGVRGNGETETWMMLRAIFACSNLIMYTKEQTEQQPYKKDNQHIAHKTADTRVHWR